MQNTVLSLVPVELKEVSIDTVVSDYMTSNWLELRAYVLYLLKGDEDLADDLMADVYISVVESERNGWKFNSNYGGQERYVNEYIRGRIKLYSKNIKYRQSQWISIGRNSEVDCDYYNVVDEEHLENKSTASDIDLAIVRLDIRNNLEVIKNRRADGGLIDLVVFVRCFDMIFSNKMSVQNELLRDIINSVNINTDLYDVLIELVKAYDIHNEEFMRALDDWDA